MRVRFYLIITLMLALTVPLLNFTSPHAVTVLNKVNLNATEVINNSWDQVENENPVILEKSIYPYQKVLVLFYILGSIALLARFILNIFSLLNRIKNEGIKYNGAYLIISNRETIPFSFLNYIFINKHDYSNNTYSNALIAHELVHCKELHSIDILLIELIKCLLWFNPLVWIYRDFISENHEYIADSTVIMRGYSKEKYLNHLIRIPNKPSNTAVLSSGFSFIHTKKRIIMLQKTSKSFRSNFLKLVLLATITGVFFTLSSFNAKAKKPFVVLVDAGHGGKDPGAITNRINEKDINLNISKKLAAIGRNENIQIILTRETDKFLSLGDRIELVNKHNPDLFISIHCDNAKDQTPSGASVYYSEQNEFNEMSYKSSKKILANYKAQLSESGQLKTADFMVLSKSKCAAVLLNVGFLTNQKDLALLSDSNYQKIIANSIYNSLVKINSGK